ncbi:hypothetical protein ACE1AT_25080 [Pelatocladus sp. BLCC-F211]|uniref:hypothetical protein n=1 Tax=Pelatocladus sp. BLCC-F211 TaxID=3342752 RepID=UPI0035B7A00D
MNFNFISVYVRRGSLYAFTRGCGTWGDDATVSDAPSKLGDHIDCVAPFECIASSLK